MKLLKKLGVIFPLVSAIPTFFLVSIAHAQAEVGLDNPFLKALQGLGITFWENDLPSLVASIIKILLIIAGIVAVIYLIIGGYQYITSAGDAEKAGAGRTTVLNAIIGLIIIFASFLIITFIMSRLFE